MCNLLLKAADNALRNADNEEYVRKVLNLECVSFGPFFKECQTFVNNHTKEILYALADDIDPSTICLYIGVCPKDVTTVKPIQVKELKLKNLLLAGAIKSETSCLMCNLLLKAADNALRNAEDEDYARKVLDYTCFSFGAFYKQCQDFVNNYTKEILEALADDIDPSTICPYIGVCPKDVTTTIKPIASN